MRASFTFLVVTALAGCGGADDDAPPPAAPVSIDVAEAPWNPSSADVGAADAVVDRDGSVTVFGSKGIATLTAGALASVDPSITKWRTAATLPSPDGLSSWVVGIDGEGRVLRAAGTRALDDVSERYGLKDRPVRAVAGAERAVFLLDRGFAVTDGTHVVHYDLPVEAIAAWGPRAAVAGDGVVRVFEGARLEKEVDVRLPGARFVAFDDKGVLFVATEHALHRIEGTTATRIFDAGTRTVRQLAAGGDRLWLVVDGEFAVVMGGVVSIAKGAAPPDAAKLVGAPNGDVWTIANGALRRWSARAADGDEARWTTDVLPVYAAICSHCHAPGGRSSVDLSRYGAWKERRATIHDLVVVQSVMPPPDSGYALTAAQRAAIEAWSKPQP